MSIIFYLCCGFLRVLSIVTGLSYLEVSMIVNIYGQGTMCVLASMPVLFYLRKASFTQRIFCIGNFLFNASLISIAFMRYYKMSLNAAGNMCIHDLELAASILGTTYIHLNLMVFIFCFLTDLFISRILYELVTKKKRIIVMI